MVLLEISQWFQGRFDESKAFSHAYSPGPPARVLLTPREGINRFINRIEIVLSQRPGVIDRVEITDGTRVVAVHERCYGRERDILDVFHYLPLLKKRPGAFDHARPLKMWSHPLVFDHYLARLRERLPDRAATMEFLKVIELCITHSLDEVASAVEQAMTLGSLGAGTVAYLLQADRTPREPAAVLVSAPACPAVQGRDLCQYDRFIRK